MNYIVSECDWTSAPVGG